MGEFDWDPVDRDRGRPAARANRILRDIQSAVDAHDAAAGGDPRTPLETRVEFGERGTARVHRRWRSADGSEGTEVLDLVQSDGVWRVVGLA